MKHNGNTQELTKKELKKNWEKKKQKVANMQPLYDNNKNYREAVNRSKGIEDNVIVDPSIPPTEKDLVESMEAIRVLEMEINKIKRDKEKTEKYHQEIMESKLQELKEEKREKGLVERALDRTKKEEKTAKKYNLSLDEYVRLKKSSLYIPKEFKSVLKTKADKMDVPVRVCLYLLARKELQSLATSNKETIKTEKKNDRSN